MVSVSCPCHSYPLNAQVDLHVLTLIMTMKSIYLIQVWWQVETPSHHTLNHNCNPNCSPVTLTLTTITT